MKKEKSGYYCTRCCHWHRNYSAIGKDHTLYDHPPTTERKKEAIRRRLSREFPYSVCNCRRYPGYLGDLASNSWRH